MITFIKQFGKNLSDAEINFIKCNNNYAELKESSFIIDLFKEYSNYERAIFYFIYYGKDCVGYICATGDIVNSYVRTRIDIYVLPQFRGQQLGRKSISKWVKEYGNSFMPLAFDVGTKDRLWFYHMSLPNINKKLNSWEKYMIVERQ